MKTSIRTISFSSVVFLLFVGLPSIASSQEAEWIWSPKHKKEAVPQTSCYFRKTFRLNNPEGGHISIVADDEYDLYVNGSRVGRGDSSKKVKRYDIAKKLSRGRNTIAVRVRNRSGTTGALAARVMVKERNKNWVSHSTNKSWRVSLSTLPFWNTALYNDRRWQMAQSFGNLGDTAPWDRKETVAKTERHRAERFRIADDFKVERLLDGKSVGSLVAMTFNEFGHIIASKEGGGLILIYDGDKDGTLDTVRPYCKKVSNCQGIAAINGHVFVTSDGPEGAALYKLTDEDRDGILEEVEAIVKFKGPMGEHGAHGVVLGPDGLIYVIIGNHTQVVGDIAETSPYSNPYEGDLIRPRYEDPGGHAMGVKSPGGTIIRTDMEGTSIQVVAGGIRNAYDLAFNRRGDLFIHDSDMESDEGSTWYRPTKLYHVTSGAEIGWRSGWAKWPNYFVDAIPSIAETGRGSPTGMVVYDHYMFPQRLHGAVFLCDWSEGRILVCRQEQRGASYDASWEVFLEGSPLNVTDIEVGPDGAIYFITGGRGTSGGVYRVAWRGKVPSEVRNLGTGISAIIRHPQLQSAWSRQNIAKLKRSLKDKWEVRVQGVVRSNANPWFYRTRALELLQLYGPTPDEKFLGEIAKSKSEDVRGRTAEMLGMHPTDESREILLKLLDDDDRYVRRKACEALLRARLKTPLKPLIRVLVSDDRHESFAARRLLESMPVDTWKKQALESENHRLVIQGGMALMVAHPTRENALLVLEQISGLIGGFVSDRNFVDMLRLIQVALERGKIKPNEVVPLRDQLAEEFPSGNSEMNRELIRILAYLQATSIMDRYIAYLKSDAAEVDRVHVALHLRFLKKGWTSDQRVALLQFLEKSAKREGGASYPLYVLNVTRDFAKNLTAEEARKLIAQGAEGPNAALAALHKLPEKLDEKLRTQLIEMDDAIRDKEDDIYKRLRVGIVAVMARSGDEPCMAFLRDLWKENPERRNTIAMGLAQAPDGKNWPYLVKSLRFAEGASAREVLGALAKVNQRPTEAKYYRDAIICGHKLGNEGGAEAAKLLKHWTGEDIGEDASDTEDALKAWTGWFAEKHPDLPPAALPVSKPTSKWKYEELLTFLDSDDGKTGSATRGKVAFSKAQCMKCHRFGNYGESIGPDLTKVARRFMRREVLESIVYPSHVISDQYASKRVLTVKGKQYVGLVAPGPQPDTRVILQADGKKVTLALDDIDETRPSALSSMPEGLLDTLSLQEIADLFAFMGLSPKESVAKGKSDTLRK